MSVPVLSFYLSYHVMLYCQSNYMEMSISWEANRSSPSQEIPCILWKLEVHYCVHKRQQSYARCITMSSHHISLRSILILPSQLHLVVSLIKVSPPNPVCISHLTHMNHTSCPSDPSSHAILTAM